LQEPITANHCFRSAGGNKRVELFSGPGPRYSSIVVQEAFGNFANSPRDGGSQDVVLGLVVSEQRFDLAAQFFVTSAGGGEEAGAFGRRQIGGALKQIFYKPPAIVTHVADSIRRILAQIYPGFAELAPPRSASISHFYSILRRSVTGGRL
jgi:hypothetical protein